MPGPTGHLQGNLRAVPDSTMKILIDNGHGIQTKGKRSPDGTLLEYAYTRDLANQILATLHSKGHTLSDTLADCLYQSARHTYCPAVLIENFFMDNKKDLAYLLSQEGRRAIVETIIDGIERCVLTSISG